MLSNNLLQAAAPKASAVNNGNHPNRISAALSGGINAPQQPAPPSLQSEGLKMPRLGIDGPTDATGTRQNMPFNPVAAFGGNSSLDYNDIQNIYSTYKRSLPQQPAPQQVPVNSAPPTQPAAQPIVETTPSNPSDMYISKVKGLL